MIFINSVHSFYSMCVSILTYDYDFIYTDGDLGYYGTSVTAYMKQKHRMIWERRHGKIGSGRKDKQQEEL